MLSFHLGVVLWVPQPRNGMIDTQPYLSPGGDEREPFSSDWASISKSEDQATKRKKNTNSNALKDSYH